MADRSPTFRDSCFETSGVDYPVTQVTSQKNENSSYTAEKTQQDRQCTYNVTSRRFRAILLQWKSNKNYIFWVCVCSVIQYAMRMRHIVICGLSGSAFCSTLSHKRHDFRKQKILTHKMCVLIFSTTFVINVSHSKRYHKYTQVCICQILMKTASSWKIFEKYMSNFMKIHPVGADCSTRTNRGEDRQAWRSY